ncbi:ABC-type transport auxiliary lipoprotein family protein [Dyella sp. EPa41]|uniref:ABC-type transport auxiliary lipoprotein family protein n=1 Tax=Dyella sp. EPa41 TaxID=1561194 RepID=UPI0019166B69|nr:ABC-type transport auxiliary lipoprotein family protein [Dyella sp. EPa41]
MRSTPLIVVMTAIALLCACSVLPKPVPQETYRLPGATLPRSPAPKVNWSLRVDTPRAERMIDGSRIVVQPEGDLMSVYKGARWSDAAPDLMRNRLIDAFRDDGRVTGPSSDKDGLQADYFLSSDLRAFQTEYRDGKPVVVIRLDAQLVRAKTMRITATHRFEVTYPAEASSTPNIVSAFGKAGDELCSQLVAWTINNAVD